MPNVLFFHLNWPRVLPFHFTFSFERLFYSPTFFNLRSCSRSRHPWVMGQGPRTQGWMLDVTNISAFHTRTVHPFFVSFLHFRDVDLAVRREMSSCLPECGVDDTGRQAGRRPLLCVHVRVRVCVRVTCPVLSASNPPLTRLVPYTVCPDASGFFDTPAGRRQTLAGQCTVLTSKAMSLECVTLTMRFGLTGPLAWDWAGCVPRRGYKRIRVAHNLPFMLIFYFICSLGGWGKSRCRLRHASLDRGAARACVRACLVVRTGLYCITLRVASLVRFY